MRTGFASIESEADGVGLTISIETCTSVEYDAQFVTHATYLAHKMVAWVVGLRQPLLWLALKTGNMQQTKIVVTLNSPSNCTILKQTVTAWKWFQLNR